MNFSFKIAKRYIVSKKSQNIINIVSFITMVGVVVAVMSIICVLSVLNGFTKMIENSFGAFEPELQIQPAEGKVFKSDSIPLQCILTLDGVIDISESLQENALLRYSDRQKIVFFKGVSDNFDKLSQIDSLLVDGSFDLGHEDVPQAILSGVIAYELGVRPGYISPVEIYVPKREGNVNMMNPAGAYNQSQFFVSGVFSVNMEEYDTQMIILPIATARKLLNYTTEVSALEIYVTQQTNVKKLQQEIQKIVGDKYLVKDRYEIHKDLYKMLKMEKWVIFMILFLIVAIAVFNIVGALTMIIIEKKQDIKTLKYLGASNKMIYKIFMFEGLGLVILGEFLGIILGVAICIIQEKFGIIKLASESNMQIFNYYPVEVQVLDVFVVFTTIAAIGFVAVLYPLRNLKAKLNTDYLRNW